MERKSVGQRLRTIMSERGWKQKDILDEVKPFFTQKTKISKTDLSQYVNDKTEPRSDKLYILAKGLNVSEQWLLGFDDSESKHPTPSNIVYAEGLERVSIPILGEIACGDPITAQENIDGYTEIAFEGKAPKGTLFALRCKGHSMEPTIPDGSLVTIREQPTVEDGEIAAVLVDHDSEATLKRIKHQGNLVMLMPDNKEFDPIILDKDHPGRIVGKAIMYTASLSEED
ncbi:XRE family transcriptional regulator [Limosilactobacillus reuteri]|uniref:LexA family protein n=1 Tax=Limosilactobacillus reuteri TaxID=1598 RepID=UPI000A2D2FE5|nr:S24 family peptidase [Limosilactobacillus reuteri]OTA45517.1 XRE family transcriptional regulator [Limosilactobacillus reuteri]